MTNDHTKTFEQCLPSIEGYEIRRLIGYGGMGTVYEAIQSDTKRRVALKVLSSHLANKDGAARFQREIELASRLEHPYIVRVYDSGVSAGQLFFSMEYVDGAPLDRYATQTDLPLDKKLILMQTVCDTVGYAHERGIMHRDLKPDNILITRDGQPRILDFGLAKLMASAEEQALSLSGQTMGTPIFMSPEQAAGKISEMDMRTDVYSLGIVLYHLVTGKYPHNTQGSHYEILRRVVRDTPAPPSKHVPSVNRELEAIILKATERSKQDRYPSASEMASDLQAYIDSRPITAVRPSTLYLMRKRLGGTARRWAWALLVALLPVIMIARLQGGGSGFSIGTRSVLTNAYDQAHFYTEGTWTNGAHAGFGWAGPWILEAQTPAGHFIADSRHPRLRLRPSAFGLWAHPFRLATASRFFATPLSPGESVHADIQNLRVNIESGQDVGMALRDHAGNSILALRFQGGSKHGQYLLRDARGERPIDLWWTDIPQSIEWRIMSRNRYRLNVGPHTVEGEYNGDLEQILFWNFSGEEGSEYDFFFNRIVVTTH